MRETVNEKHANNDHVVVCIPYYRCQQYIRRAVLSILNQTHKNLTVVVVNDADFETPPWPVLADIDDKRLVRFDLEKNRGLYFANAVVLKASCAPYFLVQDSDDWSHPNRINNLIIAIKKENSDLAICQEVQFQETENGDAEVLNIRYKYNNNEFLGGKDKNMESFTTSLDEFYKFRITHHALFKSESLLAIGGYYAGLRQHFDTLITNLLLMTCKVSHVKEPLYWRLHWPGSITKHPDTGFGTNISKSALANGEQLYKQAYNYYVDYIKGSLTSKTLMQQIIILCDANISKENKVALSLEIKRLQYFIN